MVLTTVNLRSTNPIDKPIEVFCDLTYNKQTEQYELEYIGPNKWIREQIEKQSEKLNDKPGLVKMYDEAFPELKE